MGRTERKERATGKRRTFIERVLPAKKTTVDSATSFHIDKLPEKGGSCITQEGGIKTSNRALKRGKKYRERRGSSLRQGSAEDGDSRKKSRVGKS